MYHIFLLIFLLVVVVLIILIMLQQDKGVNMGDSFNGISFVNFLNSNISSNFIFRITVIFGLLFFLLSLILGNMSLKEDNFVHENLVVDDKDFVK